MLAALSFAAILLASNEVPDESTPVITIGAWNIEWLGKPGTRSGIAKDIAQEPEDLANYIDLSDVDILALSEIDDTDAGGARESVSLNKAFDKLNMRNGHAWKYLLFEKKDANDRSQLTGLAWNTNVVELEGQPFKIGVVDNSTEFNLWDRHPQAAKFQLKAGKNDIVVIPVHMKSNRGGRAKTSQQRTLEAQALVQTLASIKTQFKDDDIVILGDANVLGADEGAVEAFVAAGYWDLNGSDEPTTWNGPAPFDRIFVPEGQIDFDGSYQFIIDSDFGDPKEHKKRLSDHYMVTTTVSVLQTDDDVD